MSNIKTIEEMEATLGAQFKSLRLKFNIDQISLAESAAVSLTALKNLEGGHGATTKTMLKVLRALGRTDWIDTLSPQVTVSPLRMAQNKPPRQRAYSPRKVAGK